MVRTLKRFGIGIRYFEIERARKQGLCIMGDVITSKAKPVLVLLC